MAGDIFLVFLGVAISIVMQIFTTAHNEKLIGKREKNNEDKRLRSSLFAFFSDVDTILERGSRSNEEIIEIYSKLWVELPNETKAEFSIEIQKIDRVFWIHTQYKRLDTNISSEKYLKDKNCDIDNIRKSVKKVIT